MGAPKRPDLDGSLVIMKYKCECNVQRQGYMKGLTMHSNKLRYVDDTSKPLSQLGVCEGFRLTHIDGEPWTAIANSCSYISLLFSSSIWSCYFGYFDFSPTDIIIHIIILHRDWVRCVHKINIYHHRHPHPCPFRPTDFLCMLVGKLPLLI